jgi:hypothetical protein
MIKILTKEYMEGDLAAKTVEVFFFNIPLFKSKSTTVNNQVIQAFTKPKNTIKIKGYEIKNKSKKNK